MKSLFLILGLALSITSKILQIYFGSIWGDILVLPAATMFVLAILFYWPRYVYYLKQNRTKNTAKVFALLCSLTVLSFQLFTMLSFGKKMPIGYVFIFPFLIFTGLSIYFCFRMAREK